MTTTHPGLQDGSIYLDYNATTPIDPLVATTLLPFLSTYSHAYGRVTREAIGIARKQVALILGCVPDEVVFTGSGSDTAYEQLGISQPHMQRLRNHLQQRLESALPNLVHLNGHPTERLPNTLNISIDGVSGEAVLAATPEVAVSTGSACHEGSTEPSFVLTAMGLSRERAAGALRLTLGRWSTSDEVEKAASILTHIVKRLREM